MTVSKGKNTPAMSERYRLSHHDLDVLEAVRLLLRRVAKKAVVTPAQLVTVAKLLHLLAMLPRITGEISASVYVETQIESGPNKTIYHWEFAAHEGSLSVTTGGSSYDPHAGWESYSTMEWFINPPSLSEYNGIWDKEWMVPELQYHPDRKLKIDLKSSEYAFRITDQDNPLLDDYPTKEV